MTERTTVAFETDGVEGDERFVREYVLPAMERLPEHEWCQDVGCLRYGHAPNGDGGEVRVHLRGDVETLVERESSRWETLVEDDHVRDREVVGPENDSDKFGPSGEELTVRLQFLASRMSRHVFEEFDPDEEVAPVDTYPDEGQSRSGGGAFSTSSRTSRRSRPTRRSTPTSRGCGIGCGRSDSGTTTSAPTSASTTSWRRWRRSTRRSTR
jgi:hypothetical protein